MDKEHPTICAEKGEPLENSSRQPEQGGRNDHGSVDELRPGGPMETSGLEKCVVEPHAYDNETTERSHQVKAQMRGVSNHIGGELRGKHSGERNWRWRRWIGRIQWFLQKRCWVRSPIGELIIVQDSTPGRRFGDLDFTDRLKIVIVGISSQSKERWNLGIEAMELEL